MSNGGRILQSAAPVTTVGSEKFKFGGAILINANVPHVSVTTASRAQARHGDTLKR